MQGFTGEDRFELLFSLLIRLSEKVIVAQEEPRVQIGRVGADVVFEVSKLTVKLRRVVIELPTVDRIFSILRVNLETGQNGLGRFVKSTEGEQRIPISNMDDRQFLIEIDGLLEQLCGSLVVRILEEGGPVIDQRVRFKFVGVEILELLQFGGFCS